MPRVLMLIGAAALVAGAACGSSSPKSATPTTVAGGGSAPVVVDLKGIAFHPNVLTIQRGQTVEWKFDDDSIAHDVTGPDFRSVDMSSGTFSHTFNTSGTVHYQCTIHAGMTGTVIVQ
jgi:plastocyanin